MEQKKGAVLICKLHYHRVPRHIWGYGFVKVEGHGSEAAVSGKLM
jgi:hypothetical protein